jgi:hypothetical protein
MKRRGGSLLATLLATAACTSHPTTLPSTVPLPSTSGPGGTTQSSTPTPTSTTPSVLPSIRLASGEAIPTTCSPAVPDPADTVVFVAQGHAWALGPRDGRLTCLFDVDSAGPFLWGPLGDRALLADLEVKSVPGGPARLASGLQPVQASWGHPTGVSIAFVSPDGAKLQKAHVGNDSLDDLTPIPDAQYLKVAYHPSGLALAFTVSTDGGQAIWVSGNDGTNPVRLVFSEEGTTFGDIAFRADGAVLYYVAQHPDDHPEVHEIALNDTSKAPAVWTGDAGQKVQDIWPGPDNISLGFTLGTDCDDSIAMIQGLEAATAALPGQTRPTRILGWLDSTLVLVASGACGQPIDLSAVDVSTGEVAPLAYGVDQASVRTPAETPPPTAPERYRRRGVWLISGPCGRSAAARGESFLTQRSR